MRDIMFEVPSNPKIEKCIITKETVLEGKAPNLIINEQKTERKHLKKKGTKVKLTKNKSKNKETA